MVSLERVFAVFLSPFESTPEEWRDRSASIFRELLGADYSMYSESTIGEMSFRVADAPAAGLDAMDDIGADMAKEEPAHALVNRLVNLERAGQLPVYTTPLLETILEGRFKETPFYLDIMRPARMGNIAGLVSAGGTAVRRLAVGWGCDRRVTLGERTLTTLRLVHPAFDAACRLLDQAEMARRALLTTIDESTDGMSLVTADGTALHRNPSLRRLIAIDGQSGELHAAIQRVVAASSCASTLSPRDTRGNAESRTHLFHGEYVIRACMLSTTLGIPPGTMLVTVTEVAAQLPLAGEIQRRFSLTRRQAEVARLLAGRFSDAEIAARLGLSWHTVRSHVDRVFSAMQVHSRQEIIARIAGPDTRSPSVTASA